MWVGVFPELSEVGGIQQVCRHIGAVLVKSSRERDLPCQLLGLNDDRGKGFFSVGSDQFEFVGFGYDKVALLTFLSRIMPRIETLYLGHVNLAPLGLILRFLRPRVHYCVVTHGVEVWEPLSMLRRLGLRYASRVIAVSAYTASELVKTQRLDLQRIFVLSPPPDPRLTGGLCNPVSLPFPPGGHMLLTVGRLISSEPGKGVDSVIAVLPEVVKAVPDVFYVVVGGGDLQPRLEQMAAEHSVRGRITFIGEVGLEQLKGYYSRADVFVMPSRQEGFGIVFLEAMSFGKPVIAGNHGGASEIVRDGITGFLVNPDDLKGLTCRLIQLLQNESLCKEMGEAGRQRLEEHFTVVRFEEKLRGLLDGLS